MASALSLLKVPGRQVHRRNFGIVREGSSPELIAGVHCAIYIRIHACVVEGTSDDCHRDRACPATADRAFVIAALPGGDTADDQPDSKKYRSDVHLDLRGIVCIDSDETAIAIVGLYLGPESPGKHTGGRW